MMVCLAPRSLLLMLAAGFAVCAAAPVTAEARGLEAFHLRVDVRSGAASVAWSARGVAVNKERPKVRPKSLAVSKHPERRAEGSDERVVSAGPVDIVTVTNDKGGHELRRLDPRSQSGTRWTLEVRGLVVSSMPLDRRGRHILVKTSERVYRVDTGRGQIVWDVAATTEQREPLYVSGDSLFEPRVERDGGAGIVRLAVRRLRDGKVVATHEIQRYERFFDIGTAAVVAARGRRVTVETRFIILD